MTDSAPAVAETVIAPVAEVVGETADAREQTSAASAPAAVEAEPEPAAPALPEAETEQVVGASAHVVAEAARSTSTTNAGGDWLRRGLVGGSMELQGRAVAFAWRQTECGLAASRAILASRSLPEVVALQSQFVGRSVENAVAQTIEITRLSTAMLREWLRSARPR